MKILFILLIALFLSACSLGGGTAPTADLSALDTQQQIGTVVAGTQTAVAINTLEAPPETPTQGAESLLESILTASEANELANRWADVPLDNTEDLPPQYCELECASQVLAGGADSSSKLMVSLYRFSSRDEAFSTLNDIKSTQVTGNTPELELPDLVELPAGTFSVDTRNLNGMFTLSARQGFVVMTIGIQLPDLDEEQNALFMSLYADRQIQKLIASGH